MIKATEDDAATVLRGMVQRGHKLTDSLGPLSTPKKEKGSLIVGYSSYFAEVAGVSDKSESVGGTRPMDMIPTAPAASLPCAQVYQSCVAAAGPGMNFKERPVHCHVLHLLRKEGSFVEKVLLELTFALQDHADQASEVFPSDRIGWRLGRAELA